MTEKNERDKKILELKEKLHSLQRYSLEWSEVQKGLRELHDEKQHSDQTQEAKE